jgi:gamma-glutamylcyclotransferase
MSVWYFAYGSNLWTDQVVARTGPLAPGNERPRIARLPNYRLIFNMLGEDGQVFANIEAPGEGVLGVIYSFSPEALEKMDEYEQGYERRKVVVVCAHEEVEAVTYVAKPDRIKEGREPSTEYLARIVRGAREHGLSEAYIRAIEVAARVR